MRLVENWRAILARSATAWCSYASQACLVLAGAVYVKADDWGDDAYLHAVYWLLGGAGFFVAIIPFVRIIKQAGLHDADQ